MKITNPLEAKSLKLKSKSYINLPFTIYHLPIISKFSFNRLVLSLFGKYKMINGNLLVIKNCQMTNASGGSR